MKNLKRVKLRLLGYYYLCIKGTPEEKMKYGARYGSEIVSQSFALIMVGMILFLLSVFMRTKTLTTISRFVMIISVLNYGLAMLLTVKSTAKYQDYKWEELMRVRKEIRDREEQERREIESLKSRCEAKLDELRNISFVYNCYSDFMDNIMRMTREVRNALTKETLERLLVEIENSIRFIRNIYGRTQEERQRKEQQHREQQRRQYEQWQQQWGTSSSGSLAGYLKILGLDPNERDMNVIKKRRKELALKYHPDNKQTGDLQKMQEINSAFDEISKMLA